MASFGVIPPISNTWDCGQRFDERRIVAQEKYQAYFRESHLKYREDVQLHGREVALVNFREKMTVATKERDNELASIEIERKAEQIKQAEETLKKETERRDDFFFKWCGMINSNHPINVMHLEEMIRQYLDEFVDNDD